MQITEYVCDECGKKRSSDFNHWRTLSGDHAHRHFCVGELGVLTGDLLADVCGQDCAVKVFSRWLSTGKLKGEVPSGKSS